MKLVVIIVAAIVSVITAYWIWFVIPGVESMFAQAGAEIPWFTQAIFTTAEFVRDGWWLLVTALLLWVWLTRRRKK